MTVESVTYINNLNKTYPAAGDSRTEGDDHIRNIKKALENTFANFTGAEIACTEAQINYLNVTPGTATASKAVVLDGSKGAGTITTATITNMTSTNVNIDGGNIDGTIIGASTQAAGSFDALTGTVVTASATLSLATGATVTGIADEDNMASDSATQLATQQSIKAYVDAKNIIPTSQWFGGRTDGAASPSIDSTFGEAWTISRTGTGTYQITPGTAVTDANDWIVSVTPLESDRVFHLSATTTTTFDIQLRSRGSGSLDDGAFVFTCRVGS